MKHLFSPRALALAGALALLPLAGIGASSALAKNSANTYSGPTTQVAAQITDSPGKCGPQRPPRGKPTDPATPTTNGTPAPRPTCVPKPKPTTPPTPTNPTTPTGSANVA